MAAFFKNIGSQFGKLADIINGKNPGEEPHEVIEEQPRQTPPSEKPAEEKPAEKPAPEKKPVEKPVEKPVQKPAPEKTASEKPAPTKREVFDNAIDKRDLAIRYIVKEFEEAIGANSSSIASLFVYVIVDREDYDVKRYAWADDTMKEQLRLSLDNAMLEGVGRKTLELRLVMKNELPKSAKEIVPEALYYAFVSPKKREEHVRGTITVVEGTGSLAKEVYELDSSVKKTYNIGRGPLANKPGAIRPNDIVIRDNDPDPDLQQRNNHVSSAHATIVASGGRFYLKALKWGCRPMGGSPTKLIYDDAEHEVPDTFMKYPLKDGYLIRLGNEVVLMFNTDAE